MIPQIDLTKLSSQDLAALTALVAERESLEARINSFVQGINRRNDQSGAAQSVVQPAPVNPNVPATPPRVKTSVTPPARPEIKPVAPAISAEKVTEKASKVGRGDFTSSIIAALEAAPVAGLSVNQLAEIVQRSAPQVRNWVHKTGPSIPGFKRIAKDRNAFFRIEDMKGQGTGKKPLSGQKVGTAP